MRITLKIPFQVGGDTLKGYNKHTERNNKMSVLKQELELDGVQDGGSHATIFTDSGEAFVTSAFVGLYLDNVTDGSCGLVTANDGTTVTVDDLLEGEGDTFENDDVVEIKVIRYRSLVSKIFVPSKGATMTLQQAIACGAMTRVDLADVPATVVTGANGLDEITWTAGSKQEGTLGNAVSVTINDPNDPAAQELSSYWTFADGVGNLIISLASTGAAYATANTGNGEDWEIVWTAETPGVGGNAIDIVLLDPNTANCPLSVNLTGTVITVVLGCDGAAAIDSTTQEVVDAVALHVPAADLVAGVATVGATVAQAQAKVDLATGATNLTTTVTEVLAECAQYAENLKGTSAELGTNILTANTKETMTGGADSKQRACFTSSYDRQTKGDNAVMIG